jgi:hypothetical protein
VLQLAYLAVTASIARSFVVVMVTDHVTSRRENAVVYPDGLVPCAIRRVQTGSMDRTVLCVVSAKMAPNATISLAIASVQLDSLEFTASKLSFKLHFYSVIIMYMTLVNRLLDYY